ncbi:MAG: IPT/TIG domain-containing protein [Candidatus Nanosyncoccaceae bacterium]
MKLVTRKLTKFQPKLKSSFRLGFKFGFKIHTKHKTSQILRSGIILTSLILITFLTPMLKKTFQPQTVSAETVTKTWQLNQNSGYNYDYNNYEIEQTATGAQLKQLPSSITLTADEDNLLESWGLSAGTGVVSIIDDPSSGGTGKVYSATGRNTLYSKFYIPINPDLTYTLNGRFKSVGVGGESRIYFGLYPSTKLYNQYSAHSRREYLAFGDTATISNYDDLTITVQPSADLSTWNQGGVDVSHRRLVGFYFDGQTNKLPDFIIRPQGMVLSDVDPAQGAYSTASGTTINLNVPIPPEVQTKIIAGTTKIKNHADGAAYLYAAAYNSLVPTSSYANFSGAVTGTNTNLIIAHNLFPYETNWAKIGLILNYNQDENFTTNFDDISLTITGSQPMYSWQSPAIGPPYSQYVSGQLISMSHTLGSGSSDSVKYQISLDDGKSWLYYNTTTNAWESDLSQHIANTENLYSTPLIRDHGANKANTIDEINANLNKLPATDGIKFKWRAFLESNGTQQVELQSVTLTANNLDPTITSVTPSIGQTTGGDTITIRGSGFSNDEFEYFVGTCGMTKSGKLYCWGDNSRGKLGDGTFVSRSDKRPIAQGEVPITTIFTQIVNSWYHMCALGDDNEIYCWGDNQYGQLGDNTYDNRNIPTKVNKGAIPAGAKIASISTGFHHTCVLTQDDKMYCWGLNDTGQLGDGTTDNSPLPVEVNRGAIPTSVRIRSLQTGWMSSCVLAGDNNVYCWGDNRYGQLGDGTTGSKASPVLLSQGQRDPSFNISQLSTGAHHACIKDSDNKSYCWGLNTYGQLGDGTLFNKTSPTAVTQGDMPNQDIKQVVAGYRNTYVIGSDDKLYVWGHNERGSVGDGTFTNRSAPTLTLLPYSLGTVVSMDQFAFRSVAVLSNNQVYAWGVASGFLGDIVSGDQPLPVRASRSSNQVKFDNTYAPYVERISPYKLRVRNPAHDEGIVSVTATNSTGETTTKADSYTYENPTTPEITSISPSEGLIYGGEEVTITGINLDNMKWKQVAAGGSHACAIGLDNNVYCWGLNSFGQLGNGNNNNSNIPVAISQGDIPTSVTIQQLSADSYHTCALGSDNKAYCWGRNNYGQLGDGNSGSSADKSTPVAVLQGAIPTGVTIQQISVGGSHTCVLGSDNKAYCWGNNYHGQLGNNKSGGSQFSYDNNIDSSTPVAVIQDNVPTDIVFQQITVGGGHTCALGSDNKAYCWGSNSNGQLGDGTTNNKTTPVAVLQGAIPTGVTIQQLSAGTSHTCALGSDNKAYCWGRNNYGQLGDGNSGSSADKSTPVAVLQGAIPTGVTIQQILVGTSHTCALGSDNKAYCWGFNWGGQLGDGTTNNKTTPVAVLQGAIPTGVTIQQILVGTSHTCALGSDNKAYCWGNNNNGQLGDSTITNRITPVPVKTANYSVAFGDISTQQIVSLVNTQVKVVAPAHQFGVKDISLTHTIMNHTSSTLSSAYNYINPSAPVIASVNPKTGVSAGNINATVQVENSSNLKIADDLVQITTGTSHTCALGSDNKAYCWGRNNYGQLGDGNSGSSADKSTPVAVLQGAIPTGVTIQQISVGGSHTCVLGSDNKAYCWGFNWGGQLGDGTTNNKTTPVAVLQGAIPTGVTIQQISVGGSHTCALGSDNKAYCWGYNNHGQLGDGAGSAGDYKTTPVAVLQGAIPTGVTIQQLSAGTSHTCALGSDNKVYCWGYNFLGQLGDGTKTNRTTPVAVSQGDIPTSVTIQQLSVGSNHACVLDSNNQVYCWGHGGYGQLGDGTTIDSTSPTAVLSGDIPTSVTIQQVFALGAEIYNAYTCALGSDNRVYCWGWNSYGQLGDGTATQRNVPTVILPGVIPMDVIFQQIVGGGFHTCALDSTGKAYCWGHNEYGQLGTNQVGDPDDLTDISASRYTPAYVMMKSDPLEVSFGTTAEHTAGTAGLATAVSSFTVPDGQYYIPGTTTLTLNTPAHSVGPVAVVVKNADGQSSSNTIAADDSNKYTYTSVPDAPTNLTANATPVTNQGINYNINLS